MVKVMESWGMEMGVFVVYSIVWNDVNLVGGDEEKWQVFFKEIGESVEVVKWVNVIWMMVVFGLVDMWQDMGY